MRTALALLLALVIAFGGLMGWTNAQLQQQACEVPVSATTLAGDPAEAAGIHLTTYFGYGGHQFWVQDLPADDPQAVQTRYGFSQNSWYEPYDDTWDFDLGLMQGNGWSSTSSIEDRVPDSLLQLLKRIGADNPQVVNAEDPIAIDLSRYTDHFPLQVSLPSTAPLLGQVTESQLLEVLESYFFIPVPEGTTAEIKLEELADGKLSGYSFSLYGNYYFYSQSVNRGDIVYFTLIPEESEEVQLDTSHIPGGLGVYRLSGTSLEDLSLTTLYSLPDGGRPLRFFEGPEGDDSLYLLSLEGDTVYLTQLDDESGQPRVRLPLFPSAEDGYIRSVLLGDNCMAVFGSAGPFTVLVPDGRGGWQVDLTGDLSAQYDRSCYPDSGNCSLLYDGNCLAVAGRYLGGGSVSTNYYLSVYDRDGLAYLGLYRPQLPSQVSPLYQDSPSHVLSWSETAS